MHVARFPVKPEPDNVRDRGTLSLVPQVQTGLNLFLRLKNPAQMPALSASLVALTPDVHKALEGLHYVHFARFLPSQDYSTLMVITVFDGDLRSYIMDFVAVLGDVFNAILDYVQDAPRLPVQAYPDEFWAFVQRNNMADVTPWSAYPHVTVIDVQRRFGPVPPEKPKAGAATPAAVSPKPAQRATPVPPARSSNSAAELDLNDIQGNILRGYRMVHARHFALTVGDPGKAARFVRALVSGDATAAPQVTTAATWKTPPEYCLNVGFTWEGFRALRLPDSLLALFPPAFRQGPYRRESGGRDIAGMLGDTGLSAPGYWALGGPANQPAHVLVSLYVADRTSRRLETQSSRLRRLFETHELAEIWCQDADAMPDGQVHFGYRDGIAQPRIAGVPGHAPRDMQPLCEPGEFLLGKDYRNQYDGNFLGELPHQLGDNASYGAFCVLRQEVRAFDDFIKLAGKRYNLGQELVAAKLMGRWRDGTPLVLAPDAPREMSDESINAFDYAPGDDHPAFYDDRDGMRCPIGSHIRRLNPRGALVMGKPYNRRIIRRAMPYGPPFDPALVDDGHERGLVGYFICGDLEMQFEFLQGVWANEDLSTSGLHGTRDPILGAQPPEGGKFVIRTADSRDPVTLDDLPRLVNTRGRVYTMLPGMAALRFLASMSAAD